MYFDVLSKITSKTKAVIPVHLFGLCVDIDKLKKDYQASKNY